MNTKNYFIIIFYFLLFLFSSYISWPLSIINIIVSLILYLLISFTIYRWWKKIRKSLPLNFKEFALLFFYKVSLIITIVVLIIWWFSYYQNNLKPAKMPIFTITNWNKTVVFIAMSHIWSRTFYNKVKENIVSLKEKSYVLFYEWVKWWTKENIDNFNEAIWLDFNKDIYKNFSKLYGLEYQNTQEFLWLVNKKDYNKDLNIDEIMTFYNKKSNIKENKNKKVINIETEVVEILTKLNPKELVILRYINRAIVNFIIKNDNFRDFVLNKIWNKNLFDVILWKRNELLAKEIINSKHKKIIITYWLMHFKWVLELLKKDNNNWAIYKTKYLYPIKD